MNFFSFPSSLHDFFSSHFPLHEFFFWFFPHPPHHFSNGPSLIDRGSHWYTGKEVIRIRLHPNNFSRDNAIESRIPDHGPMRRQYCFERSWFGPKKNGESLGKGILLAIFHVTGTVTLSHSPFSRESQSGGKRWSLVGHSFGA